MRIGDLSRRSEVSVPTIKYYLREGLLPAGTATAANQADYGDAHLRRLRLIRALIDVGRLSVAAAREVLSAVDTPDIPLHDLLGVAHFAVARDGRPEPGPDPARAEVESLIGRRGWDVAPNSPAIDQAAAAVRTLRELGADDLLDLMDTYADAATTVAEKEVAVVVARRDPARVVEGVVTGTVLGEALLNALRMLAQQDASARRLAR